ncbi:MAG: DUF547 domain-containing protein [Candidatus Zixiibacteriota bacterium]|nr:MAG: DUF547 domain-containing protein [candidate division Zixibacteria bacterium]
MRKLVWFVSILLALQSLGAAQSLQTHQHLDINLYQRVLEQFISPATGRVNYDSLKVNRADLDSFVAQLARTGPFTRPEDYPTLQDTFAFWANAYNALVLKGVVDNYPVSSVKKIKRFFGFFKRYDFELDGRTVVLDDIEHRFLRPLGDPRVHFAVNCASISCPRLFNQPWSPEILNEQLDRAARIYINDRSQNYLDPEEGRLYLSSIFKWYRDDFEDWLKKQGRRADIREYVQQYFDEENQRIYSTRDKWKVKYLKYDWGLNRQ